MEEELADSRRFGSNLDLESLRLEDKGFRQPVEHSVRPVVDTRLKIRLQSHRTYANSHEPTTNIRSIESRGLQEIDRLS